jgi:hypothetical protein
MKLKYTLPIFLAIAFCGCKQNNESILLRLKYKKGEEKTFTLDQNASRTGAMDMHNQIVIAFLVDSVASNGTYIMTARLKGIKMDSKAGEIVEHYDSHDKYTDMDENAQAMDKTLDAAFSAYYDISVDDRGNVVSPFKTSVVGADAPIDMSEIQLIYPEHKVKVGDRWTGSRKNKLLSTVNQYTYTVSDITPQRVIIKVNADIKGIKALTGDMKAEGEYVIDKPTAN